MRQENRKVITRAERGSIKGLKRTQFRIGDQHRAILKREGTKRRVGASQIVRELIEGIEGK